MHAFKVPDGAESVEIPNVGIADDKAGVPLERAAERLHELQDEHGKPLTGNKLTKAAHDWAASVGLIVGTSVTDAADDEPAAAVESDSKPDDTAAAEEPAR